MNYRNIYRVLSVKNAYFVLKEIYEGCKIDSFKSFEEIRKTVKMGKPTLRRITNRLSACGLIESRKDTSTKDGRKRVFVVTDIELIEKLIEITEYIAR